MTKEEWVADPGSAWTVELTCGHEIEVPAVAGSLATMACVTEHERQCHGPARSGLIETGFSYPMAILRGVASR